LAQGIIEFSLAAEFPRLEDRQNGGWKGVCSLGPALPCRHEFGHVDWHVARPLSLPPGITTCEEKEKWLTRDPMDGQERNQLPKFLKFFVLVFFTGKSRPIHAYYR
jgi:hypothetical protein